MDKNRLEDMQWKAMCGLNDSAHLVNMFAELIRFSNSTLNRAYIEVDIKYIKGILQKMTNTIEEMEQLCKEEERDQD